VKKIVVILFSVIITLSFSAIVFAANHATPCPVKIAKQLILSEDEPAPPPDPVPEPTPAPEPAPVPDPGTD
jgi:hypothetical protein